jgi:hypothetical protein
VAKRILLGLGLFLAGAIIGFEIAWVLGLTRARVQTVSASPRETITLSLSAEIDGSERFIFTPERVWNEHGRWDPPKNVMFNGVPWKDLSQPPPDWIEMATDLDLTAARILTREGRDIIALEPSQDGFELLFADTLMGAGNYAVTISIPKK